MHNNEDPMQPKINKFIFKKSICRGGIYVIIYIHVWLLLKLANMFMCVYIYINKYVYKEKEKEGITKK